MSRVASAAGSVFGSVFGAAAAVRGTKPLHPRGSVHPAELLRTGARDAWGVPWLDEPGRDRGLVRLSRSIGLPRGWPDVLGLAFRFTDDSGAHDLLLASTRTAPLVRHAVLLRRDPFTAAYSSSFTYDTPRGPVVLAATPRGQRSFTVQVAHPWSRWQEFAVLHVAADLGDPPVDLDPVRNPLPGLSLSPVLAALRAPSYARARAHRDDAR